jgi:hypothetical protein
MPKKRLKREVQCAKCPWKKSTDPNEIPGGYCAEKHERLKSTIAEESDYGFGAANMACHESMPGDEYHCIGWLMNQMGPGNNIALRIRMIDHDLRKVRTVGPQHERLEDTLPKEI